MAGLVMLASSNPSVFLASTNPSDTVVFVPTAATGLPDEEAIVGPVRTAIDDTGATRVDLDLARATDDEVDATMADADAVLVGGGNPYALLDAVRRSGFAEAARALLARGGTYAGISAGAMVAGPTLEPLRSFAPFPEPASGVDLSGMHLTDMLVLPHTNRDGRRERHEAALAAHGRSVRMLALADGEIVVIAGDGGWELHARPGWRLRPATAADASAIGELFVAAGRVGWASFLTAQQLDSIVPDVPTWIDRIETAGPDGVTVAIDDAGVAGFIWVRQAIDLDLSEPTGEVATFYTHPRVWGGGVGRRLMAHGLDRLRAMGYTECVLWTEERNERPRRIYTSSGWTLDGARRSRDFHGIPINELRHRLPL